jgi:hypothetical protein
MNEKPNSLLRKLQVARATDTVVAEAVAEEIEDIEELPAYGWLRGTRERGIMLELRFKTGRRQSFGYPWLFEAEFDPSQGIVLNFTSCKVAIGGRNLRNMFDLINRHRCVWIQETDGLRDRSPDNATVVTSIAVAAVKDG